MFGNSKCCYLIQCICRRPGLLVFLVLSAVLTTPYLISENFYLSNRYQNYMPTKFYNETDQETTREGFLVWNPKCQIVARNPLDQSIKQFVRKEKFESCRTAPLLTKILTRSNDQMVLKIDPVLAKNYVGLSCCWAPIERPMPTKPLDAHIDFQVIKGKCEDFEDEAIIPEPYEVVLVKCKAKRIKWRTKKGRKTIYENVHALLRLKKVLKKLKSGHNDEEENSKTKKNGQRVERKLSVLIIGMDNVSRLNFQRSMPTTTRYLQKTGWTELKGYNKMADNTFPNLMAILTGLNVSRAYETCSPTKFFGLDNCPLIWYAFQNSSYVTAYGEDATAISTFDYMKAGFVNPPTDFYLRPYLIAAEKFLVSKRHLNTSFYCTGPEPSADRILNFALDFAKKFIGTPYFGFFWINAMSHDNMNGPSSVDNRILQFFEGLENAGILDDSMLIFLSDHGLRYGLMRETVQGWYEEKLPFNYIWLPEWYRTENREAYEALKSNGGSLTSPYNLYETLREILISVGGEAEKSESCPQCESLFSAAKFERGCEDVGVGRHWCSCTIFGNGSVSDKIAVEAAREVVNHIDNIAKNYKDSKGRRICADMRLKKVIKMIEMLDSDHANIHSNYSNYQQFLCQVQVTPGNGKFEATVRRFEDESFAIIDEVSRINTYKKNAECLDVGYKQYCFCK